MPIELHRTAVVAALAGLVLAGGCPKPPPPAPESRPVAVVNNQPLGAGQLRHEVWRMHGRPTRPQDADRLALARIMLEQTVDHVLLEQAALATGVTVDAVRAQEAVKRAQAGYRSEDFNAALHAQQLDENRLRQLVTRRMLVEHFLTQKTKGITVTDVQIEKFYAEHPERFHVPAQVRARQVVVRTPEEAQAIAARLRKGEDFSRLATAFSVAPESQRGGDLGYFHKGVMPKVFDDVCFALKPGEISEVITSEYGQHIFQVTERRPEQDMPLELVREEIRAELLRSERELVEQQTLAALRQGAVITVDPDILKWVADWDVAPSLLGDAG